MVPEIQSKIDYSNYLVALCLFVVLGRLHELFPQLNGIPVGRITLVLAIASAFIAKNKPILDAPTKVIIGRVVAFFALAIISVTFSVWKSRSLDTIVGPFLSTMILFFLIIKTAKSEEDIKFYIKCLVVCAIALAYSTISLKATGRLSVGKTFDPNDLAMVLVTIFPFIVVLLLMSVRKYKLLYSGAIIVSLIAVILTGSRGGFLGLVSVGAYLLLTKIPNRQGVYHSAFSLNKLMLIVFSVSVLLFFSPESYWERILTIFNPEADYNMTSSRGRIAIWMQGMDLMLQYPYGVGIGAFTAAQGMIEGGQHQTAHNSLILVGAELGILGLFLFLSLYFAALKSLSIVKIQGDSRAWELNMFIVAFKAALLGFFVTSFFLSQSYSPVFFVLLALAHSLGVVASDKQKQLNEAPV